MGLAFGFDGFSKTASAVCNIFIPPGLGNFIICKIAAKTCVLRVF